MIRLTREVRFALAEGGLGSPKSNSWSGWPSLSTIAPFLSLRCTLQGELETESSYLCNIKVVDDAVRRRVIELGCRDFQNQSYESLLRFAWQQLIDDFPSHCQLQELELVASPFLSYFLLADEPTMIRLTQQFEFSASHRLHNPQLSDERNRELFGKCNNPLGHGHNYVVAVTVTGTPEKTESVVSLPQFEALVKQMVIDRLDHKNLNAEVQDFAELNPSVENIAKVIWGYLDPHMDALGDGEVRLANVRVNETPKTWADYRGE